MVKAEIKTIETALKKDLHPRVELRDPTQAGRYLKMGVKHFCTGWDVRIFADWWQDKGREMRTLLQAKPGKAPAKAGKAPKARGNYA